MLGGNEGKSKKGRGALEGWKKERKNFYEEKGRKIETVESLEEGMKILEEEIVERERRSQEKMKWKSIGETEYNKWYKIV